MPKVRKAPDPALVEELVDAWTSLGRSHRKPERIDVLKKRQKQPNVCRLVGGAPAGGDIIAKRSSSGAVEPVLYEHVLAALPGTPRCHGIAPGRDGRRWTFLEHVDGERYAAGLAEHRAVIARWLGDVYSITSDMPLDQLLPGHDAGYYRNQLRKARDAISAAAVIAMIDKDGRSRLRTAVHHCDSLDRQWDAVEWLIEDVRPGLVHGDLQSKNIRIHDRGGSLRLIAFDWEFAGFGVPAADFAEFAVEGRWRELSGILDQMGFTYGSPADRLRRLATAGRIFGLITWLEWASRGVSPRDLGKIAIYNLMLPECLRSLNAEA
ncbi:phosphotransferase family enzyme [Micromonospora kangleipakensis]|uniref:Phosphotransferase family enzyme n=1 Tax=Micromonospora kangleipakensis TaxID=1077942 RepID=A0A4Q8BD30_9ACTN|nr:phosphotransferase [Micromonospora kangleipakensis]RZU75784.1 phosphotransferase family enzyme [Micromonospora kangleipakensis]